MQCVEEIEHRSAPAGEFRHEDDIDLASLGQGQDFLALGPIVFGAGGSFLPDADDLVASILGKGPKVPLLPGAGLIDGRYPAIECGGLSQLNPPGAAIGKGADSAAFLWQSGALFKVYFNWDSCRDVVQIWDCEVRVVTILSSGGTVRNSGVSQRDSDAVANDPSEMSWVTPPNETVPADSR